MTVDMLSHVDQQQLRDWAIVGKVKQAVHLTHHTATSVQALFHIAYLLGYRIVNTTVHQCMVVDHVCDMRTTRRLPEHAMTNFQGCVATCEHTVSQAHKRQYRTITYNKYHSVL